jgi:hydroxymethylbilane synthase
VKLRLGTRGSDLARTQSTTIAESLGAAGHATELKVIRTAGDRSQAASFGSIGPQGVFVREIEEALAAGDVDLAVHSFKDLPTHSPDELTIAAVPARRDAADILLARPAAVASGGDTLLPLVQGARIGTASARRRVWLEHFRPDLKILPLRGNVPTRVKRLKDGDYDAILLAAAGIDRLKEQTHVLDAALAGLVVSRLDPQRFVPAPAQGALAVQCRRDRADVLAALAALDDEAARTTVGAERDLLARVEGGCEIAFGAHCARASQGFGLVAMLERDGRVLTVRAQSDDPKTLAAAAWRALEAARVQ